MGTYLFQRISADGSDSRFDDIRQSPPKFFGAFFAQATWVSLCLMPVLAINSLPVSLFASLPAAVGITDLIGILLYVYVFPEFIISLSDPCAELSDTLGK